MSRTSSFPHSGRKSTTIVLGLLFIFSTLLLTTPSRSVSAPAVPVQKHKKEHGCGGCSPLGNQEIYVPLVDLPDAQRGELVFNSRSVGTMNVTPVFYKRNGAMIVADPVAIDGGEIRYVEIKSLLPDRYRNDHDWGGFALKYFGTNREMWSQFRFLGMNGGGSIDEFFTVRNESRAASYEAAWWGPEKSEVIIALGNITDTATTANVSFGNGETRTVKLKPHETDLVRQKDRTEGPDSLKIEITGAAGSIVPTGMITTRNGSFNSVIRFYDPATAKQPNLYANGLRLAGVTPHLVLKNTTQAPIAVSPKVIPLGGKKEELTLSQVVLDANETKEVDLSELQAAVKSRNDLDVASVEVTNWSAPGSLIGAIYAVNKQGTAYDVPLRDSGAIRSMTGAYPWKIEGDYKSVAYITNITDQPVEYIVELAHKGGKFIIGPRKLAPRETATYDVESIRDSQTKDMSGHVLPATVMQGQFRWAIRGSTNGQVALIGRTEMVSRSQKVSTSYSCPMDCGPSYDAWLTEAPDSLTINQFGIAAAVEVASWNYGYQMGPYSVTPGWSADPELVSFSPSGMDTTVTGTTDGEADVSGFVGMYDRYDWDGLNCVFLQTVENSVGFLIAVLKIPRNFVAISVTDTNLGCPAGTSGYGVQVKYAVANLLLVPIPKSGMTPRERFFVNGVPNDPNFLPFATPAQTDSVGAFNDIPVGSCFGGNPLTNVCVDVEQIFDVVVPNDNSSPYSILTVTRRRDCRLGIRVTVDNGFSTQTFTKGTVN
jgi:hypothetical protein